MLAGVAIWVNVTGDRFQVAAWRDDLWATLAYVANWRFVISGQSYFDLYAEASPVRHAWSLAIEEQFYFVWPVIVVVAFRLVKGRRMPLAVVAAAAAAASAWWMSVLHDPADPSRAYYGTDTRAGQLLIGAILGLWLAGRADRPGPQRAQWVTYPAVAGVFACFWMLEDTSEVLYRFGFSVFSLMVAALIAAVVVAPRTAVARALSWAPLRGIGAVSYGIYLWHWPVQIAISPQRFDLAPWAITAWRAGITIVFTLVSYWLVETPVRHRRAWGALPGWRAAVATAVAVAVAGSAIAVSARRDTDRPDFLVIDAGQILETPEVTPLSDGSAGGPGTVVLTGDSAAGSFQNAAADEARRRGIGFAAAARPGCGLIGGLALRSDDVPWAWSSACTDGLGQVFEYILEREPTTIVWFSSWDAARREVDGVVYEQLTPQFAQMVYREIGKSVTTLTRDGAKVVLVSIPGRAIPNDEKLPAKDLDERALRQLNAVLDVYALMHPDTTLFFDLAAIMCPGGTPCPRVVEGVVPRPRDGTHFDRAEGSAWVARTIFDWLEENRG
jgi:peptidoglycan/LPS O-acetylase OafA/YrhL